MDEAHRPGRPLAVKLLWLSCGLMIFLGLCSGVLGGVMIAAPELCADAGDEEDFLILGGVLAAFGLVLMLFHFVPLFLPRKPTSWGFINTFLIVSAAILGIILTPLVIIPLPPLIMWSRDEVKEYYGIIRQRRRCIDDGWDEQWDKPNGRP